MHNYLGASNPVPLKLQGYCPDPQNYNHVITPLKPSAPKIPIEVLLEATKPIPPFPWLPETDMNIDG